MSDLVAEVFRQIAERLFDSTSQPRVFELRPKKGTQDDPFDEFLAQEVLSGHTEFVCTKAPGPLVTPDMVISRENYGAVPIDSTSDCRHLFGLEVKKLERQKNGAVARSSGLDYNTTPPCGLVRVYDSANQPVDIRSFYLFVCLEGVEAENAGLMKATAMVLCDGNLLNEDFKLYLSIVGERTKQIGLGTFEDGADRQRPMLIFSNPLGAKELDHTATLLHESQTLEGSNPGLRIVCEIHRTVPSTGETRRFFGYRLGNRLPSKWQKVLLTDPFPTPTREVQTRPRGRFRLPFRVV